jgi:hypothetical protein
MRRPLVVGALLLACDPTPPTPSAQEQASATRVTPEVQAATPESRARSNPRPAKACRALSVVGRATRSGGAALTAGAVLDDSPWLTVAEDGSISVKHARTARELTIRGPALFSPCHRGEETFLLHHGKVETSAGPGARPGAEVHVATPLGVVRYGDATLKIHMGDELQVSVLAGKAWLDGATGEAPVALVAGATRSVKGPGPDVKSSLASCNAAARQSKTVGIDLLKPGPQGPTLGRRAGNYIDARRAARKACEIAAVMVGGLDPGPDRLRAEESLQTAHVLWTSRPPKRQVAE